MSNRMRIVLEPSYMKAFNCIGSECEDSCCIGWKVVIDKGTYLRYKKAQDKELKPLFQRMINRERHQNNDVSYGKIKMVENGGCPFLDKESLCKIHRKLGAEYLSDTCALYPRHVNQIDGRLERSAVVSCPEIARIALLYSKGIQFEQVEEDIKNRISIQKSFDTEGHLYINRPERYFWDIRMFSLSLLQDRRYTLGERLVILGMVYKRIDKLYLNNNIKEISSMLENMSDIIETMDLKKDIENIPTNIQMQFDLAKGIIGLRTQLGVPNQRYKECINETLIGLGLKDGEEVENMESIVENYKHNYNNYLLPYIKEKEYILENYLVNEYFKDIMPFGNYGTIWDSYIFLCILYGMIKLHMIGMAGYHKGLTDDLTLKLIQSFSKVILHNNEYIQGIIKLLKEHEYDSLAYMSILVKN